MKFKTPKELYKFVPDGTLVNIEVEEVSYERVRVGCRRNDDIKSFEVCEVGEWQYKTPDAWWALNSFGWDATLWVEIDHGSHIDDDPLTYTTLSYIESDGSRWRVIPNPERKVASFDGALNWCKEKLILWPSLDTYIAHGYTNIASPMGWQWEDVKPKMSGPVIVGLRSYEGSQIIFEREVFEEAE